MCPLTSEQLARVAIVGTTGCGKTTFARRLAELSSARHIELDELFWGPNWTPVPGERFREAVRAAIKAPRWVCDGNYHPVRDLIWGRATAVVWLNYPLPVVFGRALRRTFVRSLTRQPIFSGNRESLSKTFCSRDSILLWVLRTYWQRRREYPRLLAAPRFAHLRRIEISTPRSGDQMLRDFAASFSGAIASTRVGV